MILYIPKTTCMVQNQFSVFLSLSTSISFIAYFFNSKDSHHHQLRALCNLLTRNNSETIKKIQEMANKEEKTPSKNKIIS